MPDLKPIPRGALFLVAGIVETEPGILDSASSIVVAASHAHALKTVQAAQPQFQHINTMSLADLDAIRQKMVDFAACAGLQVAD